MNIFEHHINLVIPLILLIFGIFGYIFRNDIISSYLSIPSDQRNSLYFLLAGYPLSLIYSGLVILIPNHFSPIFRQLYVTVTGHCLMYALLGSSVFYQIYTIYIALYIFMYWILEYKKGQQISRSYLWISPIFLIILLIQLFLVHLPRFTDHLANRIDSAVVLMMMCLKWMQLVNCTLDGAISSNDDLKDKKKSHRQHVFTSIPSLLLIISYIFYFNGLISGPICTFEEFYEFINYGSDKKDQQVVSHTKLLIYKGLTKFISSLCWLSLYFFLHSIFCIDRYFDHGYWIEWNWIFRMIYLHAVIVVWRSKFYFVWLMTEGSILCSGMVLHRHDNPSIAFSNTNIYEIEIDSQDFRTTIHNWNIRVQEWIYHDVYIRMLDLLGPKWSKFSYSYSFFISAIWHGIYPGYFISFSSISAIMTIETRIWKKFLSKYSKNSIWIRLARRIIHRIEMLYFGIPFVVLTWTKSLQFLGSFYYIGHIMILIMFVLI